MGRGCADTPDTALLPLKYPFRYRLPMVSAITRSIHKVDNLHAVERTNNFVESNGSSLTSAGPINIREGFVSHGRKFLETMFP